VDVKASEPVDCFFVVWWNDTSSLFFFPLFMAPIWVLTPTNHRVRSFLLHQNSHLIRFGWERERGWLWVGSHLWCGFFFFGVDTCRGEKI